MFSKSMVKSHKKNLLIIIIQEGKTFQHQLIKSLHAQPQLSESAFCFPDYSSLYFSGKCFCLYPEDSQLPAERSPQILESNITSTVLFLKRMEIGGLGQCDFIDRPGEVACWQNFGKLLLQHGYKHLFLGQWFLQTASLSHTKTQSERCMLKDFFFFFGKS